MVWWSFHAYHNIIHDIQFLTNWGRIKIDTILPAIFKYIFDSIFCILQMFVPKGQMDNTSLLIQPNDDPTKFSYAYIHAVNIIKWRLMTHMGVTRPASLSEIYHTFCHLHGPLNFYTDRYFPLTEQWNMYVGRWDWSMRRRHFLEPPLSYHFPVPNNNSENRYCIIK